MIGFVTRFVMRFVMSAGLQARMLATYDPQVRTYVDFGILEAPMLTGAYVDSGSECNPVNIRSF